MVVNYQIRTTNLHHTFTYFDVGYLTSLGLTVLSTICHLQAKINCKCICQCCLANCERERKDLETGCIWQQVLCQLCWLCQIINLSGTVWHATPCINQQIYCIGFEIMLKLAVTLVCWAAACWRWGRRHGERWGKKDRKGKGWEQRHRKLSWRGNETALRTQSNKQLLVTLSTYSTFSHIYFPYTNGKIPIFHTWTLMFPSCCPLLHQ